MSRCSYSDRVERADVLRDLVTNGKDHDPARLDELGTKLGMLVSDVLVVAGYPVPVHLLPPPRDREIMRAFAYCVTFCDHAQLASLKSFVFSLPSAGPVPLLPVPQKMEAARPGEDRFPDILGGLMHNRGFEVREMPFTGLSLATIYGMLNGRHHRLQSLNAMAGPLGWTLEDLAAVADEPLGQFGDCSTLCGHVGQVYMAAIRLTTEQLVQAGKEADRLSGRTDQGSWRPVSHGLGGECLD